MRRNILNRVMLENNRNNGIYQTIITDLAILGYIQTNDAEMLLGYKIPSYLKTPDGQFLADELAAPKVEETKKETTTTKVEETKKETTTTKVEETKKETASTTKPAVKTNKE